MITVGVTPDEDSLHLNIRGKYTLLLWYGSLRAWRLGLYDHRQNQDPHWQFYVGPLSLIVWVY